MKKLRKDCAFGIHFDFHAQPGETVASIYRPDLIAELLDRVKPDFVQCDTKGHAGLSSYPTKIGTQAFEIKHDVLKTWRKLTEQREIALFGHHSGLFDMTAAADHPEWAIKDEYGNISRKYMSPFSPYADEILIPQLKELALEYNLDGAWVDGECWGAMVDYSDYAVEKYMSETGKNPPVRGDGDYEEYREFCRKGFTDYVRHYINELKSAAPSFQITSNWIFSSYMPVKPNVPVDFLSGDYSSTNSVAGSRYQSRCIADKGIAWDLMAWGQNAVPCSWQTRNRNTKEYVQYCQEAAEVISMGGAYEFFNIMYAGGGLLQGWAIPMWEKVAEFVRERESVCFKSEPVYEIAVLYPEEKTSHESEMLYNLGCKGFVSLCAWIDAIQNIQLSCNVINEYRIYENILEKVKVLVVPNSDFIKEKTIEIIADYIKNGGTVITDIESDKYFSEITGMRDFGIENKLIFLNGKNSLAALDTEVLSGKYENMERSGEYFDDNFYDEKPHSAAVLTKFGKGKIINLCFNFSNSYKNNVSGAIEDFLRKQLDILDFAPVAEVKNNAFVDVITRRSDKNLLVNLVNYSGNHALERVRSYGSIPILYNIELVIRSETKPKKIYIEPGHTECSFRYKDKKIYVVIDRLDIHKTVVAEGFFGKEAP